MASQPNVLFIMTDQQRFDTIAALGNDWVATKLIWMANGNSRLLFDLRSDPDELAPLVEDKEGIADQLYGLLVDHLRTEGLTAAFDGKSLKWVPYERWPRRRIYQFDASRGVTAGLAAGDHRRLGGAEAAGPRALDGRDQVAATAARVAWWS